jgi:glycerol-1-phosphate dehydrogenase [NAD(P)+]
MSVIFRHIEAPLFIKIEKDCLSKIRDILREQHLNFERPLIIGSKSVLELGGKQVTQDFSEEAIIIPKDNSLTEAKSILGQIKNNDVIISIGGGKVLDLGKYVATKAKLNYISVPSTPSNDGIASPIAVLKNEQGVTESLGVNMPMGILVDLNLVASAPLKNIQSGIGDLISNYSALLDWQMAHEEKKEKLDDFAASLAYSAADLVYTQYRQQNKIDLHGEKFLKTLINGLILSGIAMNIAGSSRPCSGAEHEISHAIDKLYPNTAPHGWQVAYAMLIAEKMRKHEIADYTNFYKSVGLPVSYKELGLREEQIIEAIIFAPQTRPDRYTILEKLNLNKKQIKEILYGL